MLARLSSVASAIFSPLEQGLVPRRYLTAIGLGIGAVLLRWLLDPLLGNSAFYPTLYLAVLASAMLCGLAPSIVTAVLGFMGILYWFVEPRHTFLIANRRDLHSSIASVFACVIFIILGEANRKKQLKLNESHSLVPARRAAGIDPLTALRWE